MVTRRQRVQLAPVSAEDRDVIFAVEREILARLPTGSTPAEYFGELARRAIDEVLSLGAKRHSVDQLSAPEQTYIGTRLEILVRDSLDFAPGKRADARVGEHEVDIKWSKSMSWMIGPENLDTVCLGIGLDRKLANLSVGLFIPRLHDFGSSRNRDRKLTVSPAYRASQVRWLVLNSSLPSNFIADLDSEIRAEIMAGESAQDRIRRLAELVPYEPVPRSAIRYVSLNKDDFMRRTREDRSRSEPPLGDMVCLSEKYKKKLLLKLGLPVRRGHVVFVRRKDVSSVDTGTE